MTTMLTRDIVVLVGRESTAGTLATNMRPLRINGAALPLSDLAREMLANDRSSIYQHDSAAMTLGLKRRAPVKLPLLLSYAPTQLAAASSAPPAITSSTALSQELLLEHWLGGRVASQGSTVVSSADVRTVTVTSGHGSRFTAGQMVIQYVAGAPYPRKVTGIATDTLSLYPDLPASPASGQAILGSRTFHRAESHTQTLSVQAANVESGTPASQQQARMVRGQCAMTMEIGGTVGLAFDGVAQTWDEGNLSISYTDVADDMGADVVWQGDSYFWDTSDTGAPSHVCLAKITVTCANKWREQPCMSGVEGASGVVMTGGREPATVELTASWGDYGAAITTGYESGHTFSLLTWATAGATTMQRWAGWMAPQMAFDGKPQRVDMDGEVMVVAKFRCLADRTSAGDPIASSSNDAERSPLSFFYA